MRHLLFAGDFSPGSARAWEQLLPLAQTLQARVTLFYDYALQAELDWDIADFAGGTLAELEALLRQRAMARLLAQADRLQAAGVQTAVEIKRGPAAEMIVAAAQRLGCDWIMIGCRGDDSAGRLGSVSTRVLQTSPCPVLIIPGQSAAQA